MRTASLHYASMTTSGASMDDPASSAEVERANGLHRALRSGRSVDGDQNALRRDH
jgi:hypothetical protein